MDVAKEKRAIEYLKAFEPETEPYYLCYSGGKDSDVIRILASLAGVKHDIVNNHTTVDAPETVRYIRSIPNVQISYPKETMWQLIVRKMMPPTRLMRYCCAELKERGGKGRVKITGVRRAESASRAANGGVVKVVRCEDCKYWQNKSCDTVTEDRWGECRKPLGDYRYCEVFENDFCSYGERRKTDERTID